MTNDEVLACSLSGPELIERVARWRRVTTKATSRRIEGGRMVSTYPRDEELVGELRALIAAEAECCSFMRFDVDERADDVRIELSVPDEMSDMLEVMIGLLTGDSAPVAAAS